jgi:hypothetical protein
MTDVEEITTRLDIDVFDRVAMEAASQLVTDGFATARFGPGDLTAYSFVVIDQHRTQQVDPGGRYAIACNFGGLRALPDPLGRLDYGYGDHP